ncbi:MAG TPA: nitrilase-related carbon-nitrogen hydrolase, partial [Verrucomicrobiae bacterium]|nr:nitrilase-related carbon-nitrogen hydrolase [Verrucomicrobiae bacterium]
METTCATEEDRYMNTPQTSVGYSELGVRAAVLLCLGAGAAFQLAYMFPACGFLIAVYLWCLFQLTRLKTARQATYFGLAAGMLAFAPQQYFFWTIFGPAAIALWYVCGFWIGMFVIMGRACRRAFGKAWTVLLIPFLWTGYEYFRSELYYLRFSWLNAGYVFANHLHWLPMKHLGMYGFGFAIMAVISAAGLLKSRARTYVLTSALFAFGVLNNLPSRESVPVGTPRASLQVAGVQMEFPSQQEVVFNLKALLKAHPEAQLVVLSEYTIDGPVPEYLKAWCRQNSRYLVVGAKDPATNSNYYDTAFVVAPSGEIVFRQGKSVPVQFFKDGLPAKEQRLWDSPWGKLGFCICYDLSYTRVTDKLISLGAEAIIVPTMDEVDWGRHQHEMHARVAPVRAAEYGVPIFRVGSSGISQCVDRTGKTMATAPMPGDGAIISGNLELNGPGSLPLDRYIAPLSVWLTGGLMVWLGVATVMKKIGNKSKDREKRD